MQFVIGSQNGLAILEVLTHKIQILKRPLQKVQGTSYQCTYTPEIQRIWCHKLPFLKGPENLFHQSPSFGGPPARRFVTLLETNIAPENGWLEYYFPIGFRPIFSGKLIVSGSVTRECTLKKRRQTHLHRRLAAGLSWGIGMVGSNGQHGVWYITPPWKLT